MLLLYVQMRNVDVPSGKGERSSNCVVKSCGTMPAEPPVMFVIDVDLPTMRTISAAASVTIAR